MDDTEGEWPRSPLKLHLLAVVDYRGKTPPKAEGGVPTLTAANVKRGKIDLSSVSYVSEETYELWLTRGLPRPGDVLFTTEAPVGEVAQIPANQPYLPTRRVIALRPDPEELDPRYLKYVLLQDSVRGHFESIARGSTVPRLLKPDILDYPIPLPGIEVQRRVAGVLSALDDKIELNREMNRTLEAVARAIFRSWFVDFDPVIAKADGREPFGMDASTAELFPDRFVDSELGPIPEGWEVQSLGRIYGKRRNGAVKTGPFGSKLHASDYADEGVPLVLVKHIGNRNLALKGLPLVNHSKVTELEQYRLREEDIVISRVGRVGSTAMVPKHQEGWLFSGQTLRVRLSGGAIDPYWLTEWYHSSTFATVIEAVAVGSTRPSLNTGLIEGMRFVKPPAEVQAAFRRLAASLEALVQQNRLESQTLAELRDLLLPKLLSGEIRVPEDEATVEEVA